MRDGLSVELVADLIAAFLEHPGQVAARIGDDLGDPDLFPTLIDAVILFAENTGVDPREGAPVVAAFFAGIHVGTMLAPPDVFVIAQGQAPRQARRDPRPRGRRHGR